MGLRGSVSNSFSPPQLRRRIANDCYCELCVALCGSSAKAGTPIRISELLPYPCAPAPMCRRAVANSRLAVSGHLVRNAFDRSLLGSDVLSGEALHHFTGAFGIGDPFRVKLVRTGRQAAVAFAGIDQSGVAAV